MEVAMSSVDEHARPAVRRELRRGDLWMPVSGSLLDTDGLRSR
jgi:hypothetical protein